MRRLIAAIICLATVGSILTALGSCSSSASPPGPPCLAAGETLVRFAAGTGELPGVVIGTGPVGIVFGHEFGGDMCQWIAAARSLAAKGYRSLVFDYAGFGWAEDGPPDPVRDTVAAATYLDGLGVRRVALLGASMGGAAVVVAAPRLGPLVGAVVSLSGGISASDIDSVTAARRSRAPMLCIAARSDSGGRFADVARDMCAPGSPGTRELLLVEGEAHGVQLYPDDPRVTAAVDDFLALHAPPSGA